VQLRLIFLCFIVSFVARWRKINVLRWQRDDKVQALEPFVIHVKYQNLWRRLGIDTCVTRSWLESSQHHNGAILSVWYVKNSTFHHLEMILVVVEGGI